jgi:hypothetical protein
MSQKNSTKKLSKKEARQQVYDKLALALAEFKTAIKDKKFENNLLKASKLFADDIAKAANKAKDKIKKPVKKSAKDKTEQKQEPAVSVA